MKTLKLVLLSFILICSKYSYGQGKWTHFTKEDGLASTWVLDILEDKHGNIWFATDKGLNKFDGVKFETFTDKDGLPSNAIKYLYIDKNEIIWFSTRNGYCRYDGGKFISLINEKSSEYIYKIIGIINDEIWIGGYTREERKGFIVIDFDGKSWDSLTELGGDNIEPVYYFCSDNKGNIWTFSSLAKDDFIFRYDGTNWKSYGEQDGLTFRLNSVKNMLEDSKGNLWFGACTDQKYGGLMKFDGTNWATFTKADGIIGKCVIRSIEDDDGNIWVATNMGLNVFDGTSWKNFTDTDKLPGNIIQVMTKDSKGRIWIGTSKGLVLFDKGKWSQFNSENGLADNNIRVIEEDSRGNVWVAAAPVTKKGGISVYIEGKWVSFADNKLPEFYTNDIFEDSKGNIWVLTIGNGALKYEY